MSVESLDQMKPKQWGWTTEQVKSPLCEVHLIDVRRGGFCSWHKHDRKHNVFTVISGTLIVEVDPVVYPDGEPSESFTLRAGETFDVHPTRVHRFRCPEPTKAIEVYYPASVSPADIIRFSEGGIDD